MVFTYNLMSFYLDTIRCPKHDGSHVRFWQVFALFVAHRKGFDCSMLFADVTANGHPHSDFTYLRDTSINELVDLIGGNRDITRIDIAKFDDVIDFICRKACSDINFILRSVEAPCFARINGFEIIVELRGDTKESIHLGPAEAVAYIGQLTEQYAEPAKPSCEKDYYDVGLIIDFAKAFLKRPPKEYLASVQPFMKRSKGEWLEAFDDDELKELISEVKAVPIDEQQAVIYKWHEAAIARQSTILDDDLK
jgi:hypothetical protein